MAALVGQSAVELITLSSVAGNVSVGQSVLELIIGGPTPIASCNNPPAAVLNAAYTHQFTVTGGTGPYTWAITAGALPPGITLNAATGVVSGVPSVSGTYTFTVTVTDTTPRSSSVVCTIVVSFATFSVTFRGVNRFKQPVSNAPETADQSAGLKRIPLAPLPIRMK